MSKFLLTVNVLKFHTLKFQTPNIFAQNNFWKCPKISNSGSFAKRGFLKFRRQLSSSNFLSAHSNFGNVFFFFSVTEPGRFTEHLSDRLKVFAGQNEKMPVLSGSPALFLKTVNNM